MSQGNGAVPADLTGRFATIEERQHQTDRRLDRGEQSFDSLRADVREIRDDIHQIHVDLAKMPTTKKLEEMLQGHSDLRARLTTIVSVVMFLITIVAVASRFWR